MYVKRQMFGLLTVIGLGCVFAGYCWLEAAASGARDFNFGPGFLILAGAAQLLAGIVDPIVALITKLGRVK